MMACENISLDNYCVRLSPTQSLPINFNKCQLGFEKLGKSNIYHDYSLSFLINNLKDNRNPDSPENKLGNDGTSLTWKLIEKYIKKNISRLPLDSVLISVLSDPEYFNLKKLDDAFSKSGEYIFVGWIIQIAHNKYLKLLL